MKSNSFLLLSSVLLLMQCKKDNLSPEEQLPAATQTGANTFGCLINGQTWEPDGPIILSYWPSYKVTYDSLRTGGRLTILVARIIREANDNQRFVISVHAIQQAGSYPIDGVACGVNYHNPLAKRSCRDFSNAQYYNPGDSTHVQGRLTITRFDRQKKIIAGVFDFTLSKLNCDTVRITKGRFDRQYF